MNKEYLKKFYEANEEKITEKGECEINSCNDFEDYIIATISSNIQYDFGIDIDIDKLFDLENKNNRGEELE